MSNGEVFSAFAKALPVAAAVTANTRLAGIENNGPTAQQYAPTTSGVANSLVATNGSGEVVGNHFIGATALTGSNIAIGGAAQGSGAGSPSVSITGTDVSMQVSVTTGSSLNTSYGTTIFTVTFNNAFAAAPNPIFAPANQAASEYFGYGPTHNEIYITATTTTLSLICPNSTLVANTTFVFNIKT